jgi:hypothetical protein
MVSMAGRVMFTVRICRGDQMRKGMYCMRPWGGGVRGGRGRGRTSSFSRGEGAPRGRRGSMARVSRDRSCPVERPTRRFLLVMPLSVMVWCIAAEEGGGGGGHCEGAEGGEGGTCHATREDERLLQRYCHHIRRGGQKEGGRSRPMGGGALKADLVASIEDEVGPKPYLPIMPWRCQREGGEGREGVPRRDGWRRVRISGRECSNTTRRWCSRGVRR